MLGELDAGVGSADADPARLAAIIAGTGAPAVLGVDGARMSKTRGNTIQLGASEDDTAAMIRSAQARCSPSLLSK